MLSTLLRVHPLFFHKVFLEKSMFLYSMSCRPANGEEEKGDAG